MQKGTHNAIGIADHAKFGLCVVLDYYENQE